MSAIGLAWRDLYPDPWLCARNRPNEAAGRYARKTLDAVDPLDHERAILRLVAADIRAGKGLCLDDRARAEVARDRLLAALRGRSAP